MKGPFFFALAAGLLSLLVAFVPVLWHMADPAPMRPAVAPLQDAPWQVSLPAPGQSRVFGLDLPGSTLAQVQQRWGEGLTLALLSEGGAGATAAGGGGGGGSGSGGSGGGGGALALEGYLEKFEAGGVGGRLLLAFDVEAHAAALARWRAVLPGVPTASGSRRYTLTAPALAELAGTRLVGLSFIPAAQLDAAVLTARFGAPAERVPGGERLEHWLYPQLGLAVVLDAQGRDLLQYTAPADFERRLVAPLRAAPAPR